MNNQWPQWISELVNRNVIGEDQLGVEGAAQSYQQYLVPGIITVTERARYYSYYAWVLYRFITDPQSTRLLRDFRGDYFRRHEVALILAAYSHHKDRGLISGLVGAGVNNYKVRGYWDSGDPISLEQNYFQNKLGGFGQYYFTSMQIMGIVSENDENADWVYKLTDRGESLAKAYGESIEHTAYYQEETKHWDLRFLSHAAAEEYGLTGCVCSEALAIGKDRDLLRDTFFRFDQKGANNPHARRRLTLGVALDLIHSGGGVFQPDMLRPALYLGEYCPGKLYQPASALSDWVLRWKIVEVRHLFTFGLQCLWAAFLHELSQREQLTLEEYQGWIVEKISTRRANLSVSASLDELCSQVGLEDWRSSYPRYDMACLQGTEEDEISLFKKANQNRQSSEELLNIGMRILKQFFLRFLSKAEENGTIWRELADMERLPISAFMKAMFSQAENGQCTVIDWITWVYREYILGQHEFIALEKLRYQGYNTFKFYFQDGSFSWPFATSTQYREPIRLAANRLNNTITMLADLGLIETQEDGTMKLTSDGDAYYRLILAERGNDS